MIQIKDSDLRAAVLKGMDEFIQVFTDAYKGVLGEDFSAENMRLLTGEQHTLLAYSIFREEVMEGGFCQLVQNGYGAYIFDNPFAKAMRLWGAVDFSKLLYKAKKYMMTTGKTWNGSGRMKNLWPCMKPMKLLMIWKKNIWKRKKVLPLY